MRPMGRVVLRACRQRVRQNAGVWGKGCLAAALCIGSGSAYSAEMSGDAEAMHEDTAEHAEDHGHGHGHGERTSRISDEGVSELQFHPRMVRPKPLFEYGPPFLGTGKIEQGIELPTGAVWQPQVLVYGTFRSALQTFDNGVDTNAEWANRLDLFANVQLSGTERFLFGMRPLDEDGTFTGYYHKPDNAALDGWEDGFNADVTTFFFEGDFGEIFPNADPQDTRKLDWGFSLGRQPFLIQDGLLINDNFDSIGVIRNTLLPKGGSDFQATFVYGWNEINRGDNVEVDDTQLFGLFMQADYPLSTVNGDLIYVHDDESDASGFFWGVSGVQRIGHYNTTLRLVGSHALDDESAAMSNGALAFGSVSWTPPWGHDLIYVNSYLAFDRFTSAARGSATGGPLGQTGILFAAAGIGRYGGALGGQPDQSVGAAVGYQIFLDHEAREQLVLEVGTNIGTDDSIDSAVAVGGRYQKAFGQRYILQFDAFTGVQESRDMLVGGRAEFRIEF